MLAELLAATEEAVLVAMANLGLVKRARKDLERAAPELVSRDDETIVLRCEGHEVRLVAPLARSTCGCPAPGVCRHILTGILWAKQTAAPVAVRPFDPAELRSVNLEEWAGKKLVRQAEKLLAEHQVEVTLEEGVLRIPSHHFECRWVPGGGVESFVCSCHAAEPCLHRVVCLLAWLQAEGLVQAAAPAAELQAAAGVTRSREEVLASLGQVLGEMASLGTSRLAATSAERLQTLAMSAHGVDLPRLSRLLRSLEGEARAVLARQARASTAGWLASAALTEALISSRAAGLVGTHKARFMEVPGSLELTGVGARRWTTRSGAAGLTVYFQDGSGGWATWTDARRGGLDPLARYRQEGPWQGCSDPRQASRSVLRLSGAWKSAAGQLSGRPGTRAMVLGPTTRLVTVRVGEARTRAAELFAGGLADRPESGRVMAFAPAEWEPAAFDAVRQRLVLGFRDEEGERLAVRLPFGAETRRAVEWLERTSLEGARVVGLLQLEDELFLEPVSIVLEGDLVNLTLDLEESVGRASATAPGEDFEEEDAGSEPEGNSALVRLLVEVERELEALAEAGTRSGRDLAPLIALAARLESVGLVVCSRRLRALAERRSEADGGRELLRAAYVVGQQRRLAAVNERLSV